MVREWGWGLWNENDRGVLLVGRDVACYVSTVGT